MGRIMDEVLPVVIRYDLRILWQYLVIQLIYSFLYGLDDICRVHAFQDDNDGYHHVILVFGDYMPGRVNVIGPPYMTQPGQVGKLHIRHVFYQYRNVVGIGNDDVPDLRNIIQQSDAADDIGLVVANNEIPADIDIAFLNGRVDVQRCNPQVGEFAGGDLDFVGLDASAKGDDVGDTRYGPKLTVDDPVLHGLQLAVVTEAALQRITEDLSRGAGRRLHLRLYALWQGNVGQQGVYL